MAVTNGWGQAAVNNTIDWGKGKVNSTNGWGDVYDSSESGETNLGTTAAFSNTYSVLLDGVDDFINCGNVDMNSVTTQSFSCWFKTRIGTGYLFSQWGVSGDRQLQVIMGSNCDIYVDANIRFRGAITTPLDSWNHFVFTFNGANSPSSTRVKAYLNNVEISQIGFGGPTDFGASATSDFVIGAQTGSPWSEWEGNIDEFSIWSGELTTGNISDIYNSGTPNDLSDLGISGLANWWRMGDNNSGAGTTVTDMGSRGDNATLENTPSFSTDVP